jgi:hypothetical protein
MSKEHGEPLSSKCVGMKAMKNKAWESRLHECALLTEVNIDGARL